MFRQSRRLLHCTQRESLFLGQSIKCALIATARVRCDDTCLSLKTLGAAINEVTVDYWLIFFVKRNHLVHHSIYPSTSFNVV